MVVAMEDMAEESMEDTGEKVVLEVEKVALLRRVKPLHQRLLRRLVLEEDMEASKYSCNLTEFYF